MKKAIQGYAEASKDLIARFEAISPVDVFAPVQEYLPQAPCRILDIGAGTGRDAAWFANMGHRVVAVEPARAFREAGKALHPDPNINWIDDTLPELYAVALRSETFDFIILCAVWHHLENRERGSVFKALRKLTSAGGTVILSIRQGEGVPERQTYLARVSDVETWAKQSGFELVFEGSAPSVQQKNRDAGVTWVWMVFKATGG